MSPQKNKLLLDDQFLLGKLMDILPDNIFFKDTESRFIRINKACALKFGLETPEEATGKTDFDFFGDEHARDAFEDEKKIIETGKPILAKIEKEVLNDQHNTVKWSSTTKLSLHDDIGNIIGTFGIARDITNQRNAELKLEESEKKYRSIFENIQDVFYRTDSDGIITEISPSIENYTDFRRSEIIGKNTSFFYQNQEEKSKLVENLKKDGSVSDFEIRLRTKSDKLVYASANARVLFNKNQKIIGSEGILRDITGRKRAEQDLLETQHFYNQIISNTSDGIYVCDKELKYIHWNPSMEKISGHKAENVLGKSAMELFPHIEEKNLDDLYKKALGGEFVKTDDYIFEIPETGKTGWAQSFYGPVRNSKGEITGVLGTVVDITQRKKKEIELSETIGIAGDQNKRLLNFAHIVSHNLRNHAGNISMLLSLYDEEESEEDKEELLGHLKTASERLTETIQDLNEIVAAQTKVDKNLKELNLKEYLYKIKEILTTEIIAHNVKIKENIPDDLTIEYNPAYLESILLNLLSNAIKYRHPERQPVIQIDAFNDGDHVIFKISDNGTGIDLDKYRDKLFGMYNTFHGNENAKGIGLFITKNQVESMGGNIEVDSEVNKGTTFKLTLT